MASFGHPPPDGAMLVVEDDSECRATLKNILGRQYPKLTLYFAENGVAGLELFEEVRPDVVLTDLRMPRMNGIEMAEEIRAIAPQAPIIVLTASSETSELLHSIRLGIRRYVLKPIECRPLFAAVEEAFSRIALERQVREQFEALRVREGQYRSIFENSVVGLLLLAEDGTILEANREACAILGRCAEELRQVPWHELVEGDAGTVSEVAGAGGQVRRELKVRRKDGVLVPVEFSSESYLSAEGTSRWTVVVHDVSKRYLAEQVAFLAQKDWEKTFDGSSEPIMIIDSEFRIRQANRALAELADLPLEELLGKTCCECMHHTGAPAGGCPHALLMRDGLPHESEIFEPCLGKYLSVSVTPLFDPLGSLVGAVHFSKDITQRKVAEEALRESEERLRLALESASLGSWDYQVQSGEVVWDERCRKMFGFAVPGPVRYQEVLQAIHPEDRSVVDDAVQRAFTAEEETRHWDFRVLWPDGSVHWIALHGRVYFSDAQGGRQARRFIGISMDITDRVRGEEALRESETRYRGLFNSLHEGFSLLETTLERSRPDYRFLEVNPAFEKLVGMGRGQLIGRGFRDAFPDPGEEFLAQLARVARTGVPVTVEQHHSKRDRQLEAHVYTPAQGQLAVLYADVSERRKLQEEREKNARLESLGVLAGGIAHDFNNILTAIAGNVSLARFKLEGQPEAAARLEESEKAVAKAAALTRQLLTFARGGAPVKKSVSGSQLIYEAVSLFLSGTNCKAELHLPEDLWGLHADGGQINQTLHNLLLNAVQAMPEGGIISISASNETIFPSDSRGIEPGRYLKIVIADQGSGIPPEVLPKIFDPYFTTKPTGSGLGLASVFSVVKRHNGAISASSQLGTGTTFEILLPALDLNHTEVPAAAPRLAPTAGGRTILVMDDEETIRVVAVRMLNVMGYSAAACCDGEDAVRLYREHKETGDPFAAVILDMTVPGAMGGKDAAQRIRQVDPDAVIIISSGYFADFLSDGTLDGLANGMVAKPYNLHQLSETLSQVLKRG